MATVNKDFRVKNGLIVEGSSATVNGSNILTEASTEFLQDTAAAVITGGSHSGISFEYNDSTGVVNATVSATPTFTTSITFEGTTANEFETVLQVTDPTADRTITLPDASGTVALTSDVPTTENIEDIVGGMVTGNTQSGITVTYDDETGKINFSVATLDTEAVQDIVGGMVSSNTESGIAVTYDDENGKLNFDVNDPTITLDGDVTGSAIMTNLGNVTITATIAADSVALGTDTTGDYVATIGGTDGVSISGAGTEGRAVTIANTDKGSAQNIFKNVVVGATTIVADSNDDTLTFTTGSGISLSANATNDTIEISNSGVLSVTGTGNQITTSTTSGAVTLSLPNAVIFPGTVTLNADPVNALDAATKQYVDAATAGLNVHDSVKAATTVNIDLSTALENGDTLDGVTLATGNRILVKNQTTKSQNGIYVVQASGAAVRAADYNEVGEVDAGDFFFVEAGTVNGKTGWVQTNTIATLGSDDIEFTQFSGAGTYLAGNGLTLTGEVFSINTAVTVDLNSIQTLTNKTLTSPVLNTPSISGPLVLGNNIVVEGTDDTHETTLNFTDPTEDRTITFPDASGPVALLGAIALGTDTTGNYVATVSGTANQITVTGSGSETAAVSLALPQDIATTSAVSFGSVTVTGALTGASLVITDGAVGSAAQTADVTATTIDTWSASTYSTAKYLVQMKKGTDVHVLEVLVTVDGSNNVYVTEYAEVISNASLGTTDAIYSGGNVLFQVTAAATDTAVKLVRTLIEA